MGVGRGLALRRRAQSAGAWQGVGAPEGEEVVEFGEGLRDVVPEQEERCRACALGRRAGAEGGQDRADGGGEAVH